LILADMVNAIEPSNIANIDFIILVWDMFLTNSIFQ